MCSKRPARGRAPLVSQRKRRKSVTADPKNKQTCDIRLRVRAEYCQHETALQSNVFSNKQDPLERQFERFSQANTILKSRDLGSIICDIKFSEVTYLDAFWRYYINGSLLEALKGVFITDSIKQAVGHETIKLLVNVDEKNYELGRQKLRRNWTLQGSVRREEAWRQTENLLHTSTCVYKIGGRVAYSIRDVYGIFPFVFKCK
uniref:Death effector domain-containing protein-like n=1 Tax=Phascolarctos cinereus TaxID=38626 RepID=A0A6P5K8W7_PHACI|nr:death effector domain-containing protein-like [Phascolarctos cinereus]